jgi:hypothetical protein
LRVWTLRIGIDEQHSLAASSYSGGEIDCGCGLADAAFTE